MITSYTNAIIIFFFSSRRRHTRFDCDWSSDVCSSDLLLWKGRKNAFGALGRLAPSNYVLDGVIPRTKLPQTLRHIREVGARYGFDICNIFHAGDGNLHPIVLYDPRDKGQFERAMQASAEIIRYCVEVGGALTGEHGIGMEKSELMPLLFSDADFDLMRRVHDAFNPNCALNPGKIFPLSQEI